MARIQRPPKLAMGAAWVLDYPEFDERHRRQLWHDNEFRDAEDIFEAKCHEKCLELARRATELDPGNPDWWRMRAILLFRERGAFWDWREWDFSPRDPAWGMVLAEGARHDPDNALHDYLAATAVSEDK